MEEAPAPFLSDGQDARLRGASKAMLRAAGYAGAGTCEFLLGQDGLISFLEVNPRLQLAHPVSEEVTGIDLAREMFRLAEGERLDYGDLSVHGHALEFRPGCRPGLAFHRALVTDPAFAPPDDARPFAVHTRWIETDYLSGTSAVC